MTNLVRTRFFWGVGDRDAFDGGVDALQAAADEKDGWYISDNLVAFGRNLGFLDDVAFMNAWQANARTAIERGILWRTATLAWAAAQALRREGDFIECGCYKGTSALILMETLPLSQRQFYLYDVFEYGEEMLHHAMPEHSATLFDEVRERFKGRPNVKVIKGFVPDSFSQGLPDKIAFAHIDMNNAPAEIGALDAIAERLVPGAVIILDDYGATPYREQHDQEKAWFAKRGIPVLELPTSQGMVIW